ncbi:hypothetical protein B9T07_01040 [Limnospira fusiformis CCALA 023]
MHKTLFLSIGITKGEPTNNLVESEDGRRICPYGCIVNFNFCPDNILGDDRIRVIASFFAYRHNNPLGAISSMIP